MCASGLRISTPEGRSMSAAVISPGPVTTSGRLDLGRVRVHPAHDALEVEDDVGHVLLDALDRSRTRGPRPRSARSSRPRRRARTAARGAASCRTCSRSRGRAARSMNEPRLSSTVSAVIRGTWKSSIRVLTLRSWVRTRAACRGAGRKRLLLGVQLDDELLLHRRGDLRALRLAQHLRGQRVVVGLQPGRHLAGQLGRVADHLLGRRCRP